jgi:segregation and condensation protein A
MSKDSAKNANNNGKPDPGLTQPTAVPLRSMSGSGSLAVNPEAIIQKLSQTAREAMAENKARVLDFSTPQENTAGQNEAMAHPDSGIEILVKMAEKGEIDPKNVDIIDVCDKFLKAIASSPKESLRMSGKVIFHAAVLLRLKAEALLSEANNTINPVVDDFLDFDADGGPIIYDSNKQEIGRQLTFKDLEGAIVRRAQRKQQVRERRITLDQLIAALKEAEKLETIRHEKKPKAPRIDLSGYNEVNDVDDILDLAHDEDIEGTIVRVEQWLAANLPFGESVELFQLVMQVNRKQDWVEAFLAALFLSNAGKIDLAQETFYGPLYLSLCQQSSDKVGDTIAKSG